MSAESTQVLLIGRGPTSLSALEGLAERFEVTAIIRDGEDETTRRASELGVPVFDDVSVAGVRATIIELEPDAVVVSSYDRILDAELVDRCPFVNVHYAPLPRGRGRATVNWAIINGDDTASITIHHLVAGLDAGGILLQDTVPITDASTVAMLYDDLNSLQRLHIADATARAIDGDPGTPQDEAGATYYCTRVSDDGEIVWSADTATIDRLIRALQPPFPLAFTWLGLQRVYIVDAQPVDHAPTYEGRVPGRVVRVDRQSGDVDVLTGDGVFRLRLVQSGDAESVPASSTISSVRMTLGLQLADLVELVGRSADEPD